MLLDQIIKNNEDIWNNDFFEMIYVSIFFLNTKSTNSLICILDTKWDVFFYRNYR